MASYILRGYFFMGEVNINFTTINHIARREMDLSMHEYALADLIYNLSNNPKSDYSGWCYASKDFLAEQLDLSKQTIHALINELVNKGIVERNIETKHLRITFNWYSRVIIKDSKESLPLVKKVYSDSKESLPQDSKESLLDHSKESLLYNDIYNKDNINKDNNSLYASHNYLVNLPLEDIKEFKTKFSLNEDEIKKQGERAFNWVESKNKVKNYKNFKAFFRNWLSSPYNKQDNNSERKKQFELEDLSKYDKYK